MAPKEAVERQEVEAEDVAPGRAGAVETSTSSDAKVELVALLSRVKNQKVRSPSLKSPLNLILTPKRISNEKTRQK